MTKLNKSRKFIATSATAALVASAIVPVASAAQINDFNSVAPFAQEAVQDLNDRGVIKGDQKGNFNPRNNVTRAEAATILTNALGLEGSGSTSFADVKTNAWYFDAIDAAVANGIFQGQGNNKFNPSGNLTRSEAAIILVDAFGLEGSADLSEFKDSASVKSWAQEALEIAVANEVMKGDGGNLKPNASISRQEFAVMYHRTEALETAEETVAGSVKAINNTTVEVTFEEAVTDLAEKNFAIEGLTISNKSIKQTDSKTVVLTTSAQTADVEYTVTVNEEVIGKFKGVAEVIPTKITTTTTSLQGVIGEQVTVKTQVEVAAGQSKSGIPVTFNILNNNNANDKIEVVAHTNAEGVASYTYTRYYASEDTVTAYATKKSSLYDQAKVYWANKIQLAVSEITTGNDLANETKKSYKVTGDKNATYYIAIKENLDVTPDKVTDVKVQNHGTLNFVTPYELSTGGKPQFATVTTNADGEGTFTVYGTNLTATPIVYKPESTPTTPVTFTFNKLDLQAVAPTVKFSQIDRLKVEVKSEGTANAAEYHTIAPVKYDENSAGGRTFTVNVTDKDGKAAPVGTIAYVAFKEDNIKGDVYFTTGKDDFKKVAVGEVYPVRVEKAGKATFRIAGKGATTFAKPTVFLNTAGNVSPVKLDKADVQQDAEVTYFKEAVVVNATLTVKDTNGKVITNQVAGKDAVFVYQSVDQNGFAYKPTRVTKPGSITTGFVQKVQPDGTIIWVPVDLTNDATIANNFTLAFDVASTFGNAIVKDATGNVLNAIQNLGSVRTYHVTSDNNGTAKIHVTSQAQDTVNVNATGASSILPTATASVLFTSGVSPANVVGKTFNLNKTDKTFGLVTNGTLANQTTVFYEYDGANFKYNGNTISETDFETYLTNGAEVVVTETDGVKTFNIINTGVGSVPPLTLDNAVDYLVNEAVAKGQGNVVIDATTLADLPAFTTNNVTIDTLATINVSFAHAFTGNLDVTAPNAHVTVATGTTITGDVNIKDVSSTSFVNNGTITGNVVITDANGSRFVNTAGTVGGTVVIDSNGTVTLAGTILNLHVKDAANIKKEAGTTITTITTEGNGANAKIDSVSLNSLTVTTVETTTGDTATFTFSEAVGTALNSITLEATSTADTATTATTTVVGNKVEAKFVRSIAANDAVTVTVTKNGVKSVFRITTKDGKTWSIAK